ncbi:phosphotransferase enzyme family protein [Paenibacillus alvei]|uniref:Phosphotransferase n=1 Tax=Paenibacillus alvei TaxID=44250 RepID=A0AAP6ZWN1_PAEAL|nr:phosphotransferase [Paenibacillus alvei]NOJ71370.1 phosphotransferase [Paenibacillus alvei]
MFDFFRFDTKEQKKALLARARNVALTAIQRYDIEWEQIQFIQVSDMITYKIESADHNNFLLRIHSDQCSREEISSELALLRHLNQFDELHVPEGIASKDGSTVLKISPEAGYRQPYVTIMRWVDGEHAEALTDGQIYRIGALMGRLHEAASRYAPAADFTRPVWGADSFRIAFNKLEPYYPRFLTAQGWELYQAAANKIIARISGMEEKEDSFGLIHADLHPGNIVFNGDEPRPIDFGRCGFGYYLYDMAGALLELGAKQREQFITGYESVKKLPSGYIQQVECFFIMFMIENYCHHAANPEETENLKSEQPFAHAYLQAFLHDSSFLLRRIDPVEVGSPANTVNTTSH